MESTYNISCTMFIWDVRRPFDGGSPLCGKPLEGSPRKSRRDVLD